MTDDQTSTEEFFYHIEIFNKTVNWRCDADCSKHKYESVTDKRYYQPQKPVAIVYKFYNYGKGIIYDNLTYYASGLLVKTECQKCKCHNYYPVGWFLDE